MRRLAAVGLLALTARLAHVIPSGDAPYHRHLVLDAATYWRIARDGDGDGPYWQPPLYPWLLRGVQAVAGLDPQAARLAQAALGALTAVLVVRLAERLGASARVATLAGVAAALYGPLVYFDGELLPASLGALGATAWTLAALGPPGVRRGIALGLGLGLGLLLLPTFLLPGLAVAAWMARAHAKAAAALLVAAALVTAPVTARNWREEPDLVWISGNGGLNLWLGNNPDWVETVALRPGMAWTRLNQRPRCEAGATTAAARDRYWARRVDLDAATLARKAAAALSVREIGRNREPADARSESPALRALLWPALGFGVLGPAAAAGAVALARRRRLPFPVAAVAVGVLAVGVVFFPTARYRAPALPVLIAVAAAGLPLAGPVEAVVAAGVLGVGLLPVPVPPVPRAETAYEIGFDLDQDGDPAAAIPWYRAALEQEPDHADAHAALGYALCKLGDLAGCHAALSAAVAADPGADWAWEGLGIGARDRGDLAAARVAFTEAARVNPCSKRAHALLAEVLVASGDLPGARAHLDEGQRVDPGPGPVWDRADAAWRAASMREGADPAGLRGTVSAP